MKRLKLAGMIFVAVLMLTFFSCAHATFLPRTAKVHITGSEVKRLDPSNKDPTVRDRRYILATSIDGEPISFLNEDTRWGWPFYFKFNSADLSAQAADIVKSQPGAVVLIKFYGFRSAMLDEFPNVVSMKIVDQDYVHIPIFNIFFYLGMVGVVGAVVMIVRKLRARRRGGAPPDSSDGSTPTPRSPNAL